MGRKNKSSKAAEKKAERLALERKMNSRIAIVKTANSQPDPLDLLPSFRAFKRNDLNCEISAKRVADLDKDTQEWIITLITDNMKEQYEKSSWGWKEANKREEMLDDEAWYLMAKDNTTGKFVAYSHFRFDMDYDDEVLYCYEIQTEEAVRRKGLGKFMMQVLEMLAFKADMRKIMLTVFKHNPEARNFFMDCLKFELDETNPVDDVYEQFDYQIVSKFNKRKLAREAKAEGENSSGVANQVQV